MTVKRMDNVGIVVEDLDTAVDFFTELGLELEGRVDGQIAGSISVFEIDGEAEVPYWIDKSLWGRGVGTSALSEILKTESRRPVSGRVAFDNAGSQKVLEKCGFARIGTGRGFANARQAEIEEFIYKLS